MTAFHAGKSSLFTTGVSYTCPMSSHLFDHVTVSKVTLDIICEASFGYRTDSLHNPNNPLAEAYEQLLGLQSGTHKCNMWVRY